MYRRFLNNSDYLGIITQEALAQLTRGNDDRFIQAEESAEMSIVEYLSELHRRCFSPEFCKKSNNHYSFVIAIYTMPLGRQGRQLAI